MFVDSYDPVIYVTIDEGVTYSARNISVDPTRMKIHPTMAGWILGYNPSQVQ